MKPVENGVLFVFLTKGSSGLTSESVKAKVCHWL